MKFRSGVLVACMVVVPAVAMVSHRVRLPSGMVDAGCAILARAAGIGGSSGGPAPTAAVARGAAPIDVAAVRERLEALGATAIESRSLPGSGNTHVASCRIAVDAHGELERVFHATAPTPAAALRDLLDDVETWRDRVTAGRPQPGAGTAF